jgi:hypothetical protein
MMDWLRRKTGGDAPVDQDFEPGPIEPAALDEIRRRFPMPKFFIYGYPRSGTTLLMRLVRLHPEVHCNRQAHLFTYPRSAAQALSDREIRDWLERGSNRWTSGKRLESSLIRVAADFILEREASELGKRVVGDKSPTVIGGLAVRRLHAVYPDARLIYLVRDGRDSAVSRRFQLFIDQPQNMARTDRRIKEDLTKNGQKYSAAGKSVFTPAFLLEEASSWAANLLEVDQEGRELFPDAYLPLRYEDLLSDPPREMRRVWDFLGVPASFPGDEGLIRGKMDYNPGAEDQARKGDALVENLKRGSRGGWQDWFTPRDREIFKDAAGAALIRWGYEKDPRW